MDRTSHDPRTALLVALAVCFLIGPSLSAVAIRPEKKKADPVREELRKLRGTWLLTAVRIKGIQVKPGDFDRPGLTLRVDEGPLPARLGNRRAVLTALDPARLRKHMDILYGWGYLKGRTVPGTYVLKGDTLLVCQALDGKGRPAAFDAGPNSRQVILVFRRVHRTR